MKKLFFIACLFTLSLFSIAQSMIRQADSLKNILQKHPAKDTVRASTLLAYAKTLFYVQPDSMMKFADEGLAISETLNWKRGLARGFQTKGTVYQFFLNDPQNALASYQKTLTINKSLADPELEWNTLLNIGHVYRYLNEFKQALEHYQQAYVILNRLSDKKNEDHLLLSMAQAYTLMKENKKAANLYGKAIALAKASGNVQVLANSLSALGVLYRNERRLSEAKNYLANGVDLARKNELISILAPNLVNLSLVCTDLKEYAAAEKHGQEALVLANKTGIQQLKEAALEVLADLYSAKGEAKKALDYYSQYKPLHDSLLNNDNKAEITRMGMQFDFNKKQDSVKAANDKQQAIAAANLKQQRTIKNAVLIGAGFGLLSALLLFISYKRRRDAVAKKNDAELKAQIADTEMKVMRLQMNPHFIFNSLNSIADYIHKNNPAEADAYLSKFAKVMRMTLEHSEQKAISLEDDLKTLEIYMQLEAKRLNNKFTYEIKVAADIDQENTLVPPMIFQPFVENSIWHGITKKEGQGHIIIDIKKEAGMLYCLIDDNGIGRYETINSEELITEKKSLGMKITKARIDILNKLKGSNATVQLIDKPQGLSAELKLPFETAF